jgi:hypothetical protein
MVLKSSKRKLEIRYFVFVYEKLNNEKPVEIVLRKGEGMRESDGGVNLIKIYCKHICKYHNV